MSNRMTDTREERLLSPASGYVFLAATIALFAVGIAAIVLSSIKLSEDSTGWAFTALFVGIAFWVVAPFMICGLKVVNPNEAAVYVLFGSYYGTIAKPGFYFINPFCAMVNPTAQPQSLTSLAAASKQALEGTGGAAGQIDTGRKKVSLKATTLNNEKQKINDRDGNPIDIGVVVIWRVVNATKAVFEVDNYKEYVSTQCDAAIRHVARQYPYDAPEDGSEESLRASSAEVAGELTKDLQGRVDIAGIEVIEARITHLAYAQEIAAAMLQRQQANAVIAARQKIVEGAVGMVEMALNKLAVNGIVELDDERKATMVSNLLVVLCGNKDAQPVVNSGSIY